MISKLRSDIRPERTLYTLTDASGNTVDLDGGEVITGSSGDDILTVTDSASVHSTAVMVRIR